MCLSAVYKKEGGECSIAVEEASSVKVVKKGHIEINTLFGDKKVLNGYEITEVDFLKNFITLEKLEASDE